MDRENRCGIKTGCTPHAATCLCQTCSFCYSLFPLLILIAQVSLRYLKLALCWLRFRKRAEIVVRLRPAAVEIRRAMNPGRNSFFICMCKINAIDQYLLDKQLCVKENQRYYAHCVYFIYCDYFVYHIYWRQEQSIRKGWVQPCRMQ